MAIVQGKTAQGLVKHAQRALREHWWYVWGTFGNKLTDSLLRAKSKQYPTYDAYSVHSSHIGETVSDCVGLIKGYAMWDNQKDKPVYNPNQDVNTGTMYNLATKKGILSTIPEIPGICVYMQGHVGVYIGSGWVIECTGGKGVIKTPLRGNGATHWTHWFECPFISYDKSSHSASGKVRVRQGAKDYSDSNLASWVYSTDFDVLEEKGDRVVIGLNGVVTAAVHKSDLY